MLIPSNLKRAMEKNGFTPVRLDAVALYEAGKTYWCGYWGKWYCVLRVVYDQYYSRLVLKSCTVLWEDGEITTHCTPLDPRVDYMLIGGESIKATV